MFNWLYLTMKKSILTILLFCTFAIVNAQIKKPIVKSSLPAINQAIEANSLAYSLHVLTQKPGIGIDEIRTRFAEAKNINSLTKKNKSLITGFLSDATYFGESQNIFYEQITGDKTPFGFYSFNGQIVFLFSGPIYKYSLNILRLDAAERASKVAKDVLLPGLSNFKPLLRSADISYFSLAVGYIARDFGEDEDSMAYKDGETLAIVISKSVLKQYLEAKITDEQVFKMASFYNTNKSARGVRKVTIK